MEVAMILAVSDVRTDTAKCTNVRITGFRQCRDLVGESEVFIKYIESLQIGVVSC